MRVLFWGTPEFAAPSLRALLGEGFEVVGVITQPDRAVGRSRSTVEAPIIKRIAKEEDIPVLQPERPRGEDVTQWISALRPDVSVVVAYGHILPQSLIELPPRGTLNVHASLLPMLRGAAPIQVAIREGHAESGVSIMRMVPALDAGPVILQSVTPIGEDETAGTLSLRLAELGAAALVEALALMEMGKTHEDAQDETRATYAGKITREMGLVHWAREAEVVSRQIRACDPRPGAFTTLDGQSVKLFGARVAPDVRGAPGEVVAVDAQGLAVACGTGGVRVAQVQPAGKRRMTPVEWERGRGITSGRRFDAGA